MAVNRVEVFPAMKPLLLAGDYELHLGHTLEDEASGEPLGEVQSEVRHLRVTAPRVAMAGTELFSVFPPHNAVGSFGTRLPQVALRRRTLPWERGMPAVAPAPPQGEVAVNPWLALVVVTDNECAFLSGVKAPDAITASAARALGIVDDGTRADAIEVGATVVAQVFPRKDELHLLAHVRKVDVRDSELAGNDDDGEVAVLLSNRLPQPGRKYRACLVSLEGQYDVLADPPADEDDVDDRVVKPSVYSDVAAAELAAAQYTAFGAVVPLGATDQPSLSPGSSLTGRHGAVDAWQAGSHVADTDLAEPVSETDRARVTFPGGFVATTFDVAVLEPLVPTFRFPVLASWEFTCDAGGDFETLMKGLDVGLLGTVATSGAPEPNPGGASVDPTLAPPRIVLETGHLEIDHQRRRGTLSRSWYRAPFTPREVARRPPTAAFASADQARRIATDGLEDLSEAAAFEIGRALALATPRFLGALRDWARAGFAVRRARRYVGELGVDAVSLSLAPQRVGLSLLTRLGDDAEGRVLPNVPAVDLGPFAEIAEAVDPARLAAGLGLDPKFVTDVLAERPTTAPLVLNFELSEPEASAERLAANPQVLAGLRSALRRAVRDLTGRARLGPDPERPIAIGAAGSTRTQSDEVRDHRDDASTIDQATPIDLLWPEEDGA